MVNKLDPSIGAKIRKTRPCVILNDDSRGVLPLKLVAPVTDYKEKYKIIPRMIQHDVNKSGYFFVTIIFSITTSTFR